MPQPVRAARGPFSDEVHLESVVRDTAMSVHLIEGLLAKPWHHSFFALMRRINANPASDPVGAALHPRDEPFRVGQKPSLIFAPSEVADATITNGRLRIRLHSLGVLGPNGPLPIHVTEIAREREEHRGDPTLCNFLDVFHHRSLTILYRAWASAQSAASLDRPEQDRFSFYVGCLSGVSPVPARTVSLPLHARLAATPLLVQETRNLEGLCGWINHHFDVPVQMKEWAFHWTALPPDLQCRFGTERRLGTLGAGAMLGEQVPGRTQQFCLVLGPLDLETYHRFTPRGKDLLQLVALVRAYVGLEFEWLLELQIRPEEMTPAKLGDEQRLGWSGWMGRSSTNRPVVGMRFEPEAYMHQLHWDATTRAGSGRASQYR
ncbi:type VI secretion system baseplate subunit TssG [Paraburkholderia sp. MPAMCS5]|uniref:type VI secretion system baseplate subunit TssG n=1 Tax=Paraburkholderia sp. MPAMCS5 TaxID=3112563 RepID=UPI002E193DA1|nr:type VI secretion system baseplate subunit TssG [Paraburkholderia sp. MPAMCS5]